MNALSLGALTLYYTYMGLPRSQPWPRVCEHCRNGEVLRLLVKMVGKSGTQILPQPHQIYQQRLTIIQNYLTKVP